MKIKFCGAAQQVTGSCHLVILDNGFKILLDCGLFQDDSELIEKANKNWLFDPREIDAMILSHAHIDHCGRIPKLIRDGFKGHIYCTHATRDLASIMLMDTAKIQERDAEYFNKNLIKKAKRKLTKKLNAVMQKPLFTSKDVQYAMNHFVGISYGRWFNISSGIQLMFTDAGHILGSASVHLKIHYGGDDLRLSFTGDIGRPNRPILRDPQPMPQADIVICESTYGSRLHIEKPMEMQRFLSIIKKTCVQQKGKLLIPAFSVGRTQEVLYILNQLVNEKLLPLIPVYIDSPLSISATEIFRAHPECFDEDLYEYIINDPDPFAFRQANFITEVNESKKLNSSKEAAIIISASGMMNAGRSKHHLANMIEQSNNTILLVGYCSPETPGGKLAAGATVIKLFGELKNVNASVEKMDSFSAHGDYRELIHFLDNQKNTCKQIYLVHGELESQSAFQAHLKAAGFPTAHIPKYGELCTAT